MLHFEDIIFGPIYSRRLGNSLGVNILPIEGKLCNFDCIYCECGWNKDGVSQKRFPTLEEVDQAVRESFRKLSEKGEKVDSITFSGNGEPTLHPQFADIVDRLIQYRDEFLPQARISVLSNATRLGNVKVLEALKKIDNPILKIDAGLGYLIGLMNRPHSGYDMTAVIEGLKSFDGDFILQTMFLKSPDFDLLNAENVEAWRNIVRVLKPREIMVYTIDRETPDKRLEKISVEQMEKIVEPLIDEGFKVQVRG